MPSSEKADFGLAGAWRWVALERDRAVRASVAAQRHEQQFGSGPEPLREHHRRMAATYRQVEQRHLAAARIHELQAVRLRRWVHGPNQGALRPAFMAAVAAMLGMDSAMITLVGHEQAHGMVAVSDSTARAAHDLEFVLGEGPSADAGMLGDIVVATGSILRERWPQYGAAVAELGVRTVVAMPLALPTVRLGTLCAFDSRPELSVSVTDSVGQVADALTHTVLLTSDTDGIPLLPLFTEGDYHAIVHQAVGMVSVQCDCSLDDALAMLRARAFVAGQPITAIAEDVVAGRTRLVP